MDSKVFYNMMEEYRKDRLSPKLKEAFEESLTCSDNCQKDYKEFIETVSCLEQLPVFETPANLRAMINRRIDTAKKSLFDIFFGIGHNPYYAGLTVGAALLLMIVASANIADIGKSNHSVTKNEIYTQSAGLSNDFASQFGIKEIRN